MNFPNNAWYFRASWFWLIGFTLFRFAFSATFPLVPDETNYWQWSRYLDWAYHDQTPMIAWLIRLSTLLFGDTEIGVRFPSVMAMAVVSAYLIVMARRWFNSYIAFQVTVLSQSVLVFNLGGLLSTPDGIQAAAWAGACFHAARGYEDGKWRDWMITGLWFGFGMLSKYSMVIFLPAAYGYGLFSHGHRKRLATLPPYVGVLIGCLMFLPVIVWNAKNDWNSFQHVAGLGGAGETFAVHLPYLGDYLASQIALVSPLVFILLLMAWTLALSKSSFRDNWLNPYLFFTSFTMFAAFAALSLHTQVYGNWPAAGYIPGSLLTTSFFAGKTIRGGRIQIIGRKLWPWALVTSYLITGLVLIHAVYPIIPISPSLDRTATELSGWQDIGHAADELLKSMPNPDRTFLFGLKYQHASELAFYTPGKPRTVSINKWSRPNVYDYWWQDEDLIGWDAVGISGASEKYEKRLKEVFQTVDAPVKIDVYRKPAPFWQNGPGDVVRSYYFYRAYGFKGGLRPASAYQSNSTIPP